MFRRRVIAFLVDQELLPRDRAEMLLSWQHSGFSLHRSRRVGHEEREDPRADCPLYPAQPVLDGEDALRAGCRQCPLPLTHEQEAGRQLRGALAHRLHRGGHPSTFPSSCATTLGIPTRLGAFAPRRARRKPKTLLKAMSRIVRPPRPSGGGSSPRSGRPTR